MCVITVYMGCVSCCTSIAMQT